MLKDNEVVRKLKLRIKKLEVENKLMKLQLTHISKIDFGWKKSNKGGTQS